VLVGVAVVAVTAVAAAPASLATQFLPAGMHAADLSGTVWHGSTETLTFAGRRAGALEWQLHPAALLGLKLDLSLHWVLGTFSASAGAMVGRDGVTVTGLHGGGPIEDLASLGVPAGWRGASDIEIERIAADWAHITSLTGSLTVSDLTSTHLARGAPLGSYTVKFPANAVDAAGAVAAALDDAGGPLAVHGTVTLAPLQHTGMLSFTVLERAEASAALRDEIGNLASMRGRDRDGRIPVDLEFNY